MIAVDKNKTFYREIGSEKYREEIRLLQNRILELQNESDDLTNKLTKAVHANGIYLDAMEEMIYNNNPTPAEDLLAKIEPRFSENHTAPNQFLQLNKLNQKSLIRNIPLNKGDVFYHTEKKTFLLLIGKKEREFAFKGYLYCQYDDDSIGDYLIPCYTLHQLWDFLEDYLDASIEIKLEGVIYKVCSNDLIAELGFGKTKMEALWNSVVNVLDGRFLY